jgi:hypothetical protein
MKRIALFLSVFASVALADVTVNGTVTNNQQH